MVSLTETESHGIAQGILETYHQKTAGSRCHDIKAKTCLPGGDTRSSTYFFPYPVYMKKGHGCCLYDCDGNEYIDFLNNYTSLIHGHAHPHIVQAVRLQLEEGTVLGAPSEILYRHAEHLCARIPSMEMIRYCNSGTEATLFAIRAARAFTGKEAIVKMDGGYHGTHDSVEVNASSNPWQPASPVPCVAGKGIPAGVLADTMVAPFNDPDAVETLLKNHKDRIAAVILEPMLGAGGVVPPQPGFLKSIRELADRYGVLLIFDEVMTFRMGVGGMQETSGVSPDLTTLGKIIGGGFGIGAFGGKKEVMRQFDPIRPERLPHSGTFNGNNITMTAGLAAMEIYDRSGVDRINGLGNRLRKGFNEAFGKAGIRAQATGLGSMVGIHWTDEEIKNARDTALGVKSAGDLPKLLHLSMINRGIFSASRGMYNVSTPMTESHIDSAVSALEESLVVLKPYVTETTPHLLRE